MCAENRLEKKNMPMTEAQLRAGKKYKTANIVNVALQFNKKTEPELTDYVRALPNKTAYIKGLIRADMARLKAEETTTEENGEQG